MNDDSEKLSPMALGVANLSEGINCLAIFVCQAARRITLDDELRTGILRQGVEKLSSIGPGVGERFPQLAPSVARLAAFAQRREDWKAESLAELERLAGECVVPVMAKLVGPKPGRCPLHGDECPDVIRGVRIGA